MARAGSTGPVYGWGATTGGGMTPLYWDSVFAENLYPSLFYYQFGAKRRVPPNFGVSIKIARLKRQTGIVSSTAINAASYGATVGYASMNALCSQVVSGTLSKFQGVYGNSDIALLTSLGDPTEFAIRDISRDLALQMDTLTRTKLSGVSDGVYQGGSNVASGSLTTASQVKPSDLIRAVAKLRAANNPRWPDGNFPLVLHPLITYDLKTTLSTGQAGAWTDVNKYASDNTVEKIYRGEVGRLYGARLVETTNVKRLAAGVGGMSSAVASGASGYMNHLLAPESYYVCEMDQMTGRVIVKGLGSAGAYDATNSLSTVGAKVFFTAIRGFQGNPFNSPTTSGYEVRLVRLCAVPSII